MKATYYMGTIAILGVGKGLVTYDNIDDAIAAVSKVVADNKEPRCVVKVVAMVEPVPPPVRVTLVDE